MSFNAKEILDLLETNAIEKAFCVNSLQQNTVLKYKRLNTSHLKDIISTINESSVTLTAFNTSVNKIMRECLLNTETDVSDLNIVDRILFILNARINSLSKNLKYSFDDGGVQTIDLELLKTQLLNAIETNKESFMDQIFAEEDIIVKYGISSIGSDEKLVQEIYDGNEITLDDGVSNINEVIGTVVVNEVTKCIKNVCVKDKSINFSELMFSDRLLLVEKLPVNVVNSVIEYIESYKKIINKSLTTQDGTTIKIDGSLFVF